MSSVSCVHLVGVSLSFEVRPIVFIYIFTLYFHCRQVFDQVMDHVSMPQEQVLFFGIHGVFVLCSSFFWNCVLRLFLVFLCFFFFFLQWVFLAVSLAQNSGLFFYLCVDERFRRRRWEQCGRLWRIDDRL